jgi:hypothetical protein
MSLEAIIDLCLGLVTTAQYRWSRGRDLGLPSKLTDLESVVPGVDSGEGVGVSRLQSIASRRVRLIFQNYPFFLLRKTNLSRKMKGQLVEFSCPYGFSLVSFACSAP